MALLPCYPWLGDAGPGRPGKREGRRGSARAERETGRPGPGDWKTMLARVVTLRFDPVLEAFDDGPLQEVLKAREVFSIRDHFFMRNEVPPFLIFRRPPFQRENRNM